MPDVPPLTCDNGTPFEIGIEIIKDCTSFSNDVVDVVNLLKRNGCDVNMIMDKVCQLFINLC